ncbi:MAG TPA: hypothetical protein VIA18_04580 [Polyangia bacterium]|jgi:hypothetical protein|nr:hypothetical protein [Polyangia bacterium]
MSPLTTFSALLVGYFALLVVVSRWKSAAVPSRAVQLMRAFFPSWKFFDDIGDEPQLYMRAGVSAALGEWEPALPRPRRRWRALVLNADGNLLLACGSLVQQLCDELEAADPAHPERVAQSVAYELTRNLVQFRLRERAVLPAATRYQFKLRLHRVDGSDEDVLVSPEYELT